MTVNTKESVILKGYDGETDILNDLCNSITDCNHSTPKWTDNGRIVIRNTNFKKGRFLDNDFSYTDEATYLDRISRNKPVPGDLLISREAPMGEVCIIPKDLECCLGQRIVLIKPDPKKINNHYLLYALLSEYVQKQIRKSDNTGSIVSNLCIPELKELEIPIFNSKTENLIGYILNNIDSKIEINNKINSNLDAMSKSIYDYWFSQFDFPDKNGNPYKTSGGKMVYNEELERDIPVEWGNCLLKDIIEIHDSIRIPLSKKERERRQGVYPYYGATSVMDYIDDYLFDGIYVLLAEDGSIMDGDGNPILQYIWGKSWVNNHAHVLEAKNDFSNEYLHMMLKNIPVIQLMSGSIQKKITQDNLKITKILKPESDLLNKFQKIIKPIYEKHIVLMDQNQRLDSLRDWLLPMLMNGQVKVS